jgi:hypothetical protein
MICLCPRAFKSIDCAINKFVIFVISRCCGICAYQTRGYLLEFAHSKRFYLLIVKASHAFK